MRHPSGAGLFLIGAAMALCPGELTAQSAIPSFEVASVKPCADQDRPELPAAPAPDPGRL